jgi:hypothetical protein
MSLHVPYRSFNRGSQKIRVGGSTLSPTAGTLINLDSPRNRRDLARHTSIGGVIQSGTAVGFTSDGFLTDGGFVTKTAAGSLNLTVSTAYFTRASGATSSIAGVTNLAITTGASNPRIDVIAIDTATPALVKIDGTATALANLHNKLGLIADLPANRIPIALLYVPGGSVTNLDTATIIPLR